MGAKQVKLLKFLDNEEDRKALDKAFEQYDADKNGTLSRQEFMTFTQDVVTYLIKKHPDLKVADLALTQRGGDSTLGKADEQIQKQVARQLGRCMFQVVDKDKSGTISVEEWKATNWGKLLKEVKVHMKEQEAALVATLTSMPKWKVAFSGASDMTGWITVKGAKEITGKLGYHPLSSTSGITGSRVYLYGEVTNEFPMGAAVELWLDAILEPSDTGFPYKLSGAMAQTLGRGMPHVLVGEVQANVSLDY